MTSPFEGVITALVTPFADGKVDTKALAGFVDWQIEQGVDGLVAVGTTGESPTLSSDEHRLVVETVVKAARGRVPVIGGAGSNDTNHAIALARQCREAGADGLLAVTPYYNKPTQDGLVAHFSAIMNAVPLPTVLYNVPGRTSCDLLPETVARLAELDTVVAVKEATGNLVRASQVVAQCGDRCTLLSGDDFTAFPVFAVGGRGVISVVSNVTPAWMAECWDAYAAGDLDRARRLHYQMLPLVDLLFLEPNPVPAKHALARMGRMRADVRLPLVPMTAPGARRVDAWLEGAGLTLIRVAILGAEGRMGDMVRAAIEAEPEKLTVAGTADRDQDVDRALERADVYIDFTSPEGTRAGLEAALRHGVPAVIGTTGLDDRTRGAIDEASRRLPIVYAANFSLGVSLLVGLVEKVARVLPQEFDIEVFETHHRDKKDAPSGTALALGAAAARGRDHDLADVQLFARSGTGDGRRSGEIGFQAVRGGDVVGEHTVMFLGPHERIELTHRATSRDIFARGAVRAAEWVVGKKPGLYAMADVLGL